MFSLQDHVFINQYLIIKDLGKGAYGTVKLVYNTEDDMLYAMKVQHMCTGWYQRLQGDARADLRVENGT